MRGHVDAVIGDRVAVAITQTGLQNSNHMEYWQQYCDMAPHAASDAEKTVEVMTALRQSAQALLKIKAGTPLEAVPPDENFTQAVERKTVSPCCSEISTEAKYMSGCRNWNHCCC